MTTESGSSKIFRFMTAGDLPVVLTAAVIQGWTLYALHYSVEHSIWPATSYGWLIAFYAVAAIAPLTVQMLVAHIRRRLTWLVITALVAFYFLVGWHYGTRVFDEAGRLPDQWPQLGIILVLQWLLILPFVQARLIEGRWRAPYQLLFSCAWNNKILLGEAVAFTGLFWLMLILWAQLFRMLGIQFFRELFEEPIFIYPVTSIVFGIALKLIGSVEALTRVVLEQTLNVLKWLALLAGIILAFFTVALIAKLPGMIASSERAIGAAWLLWLVAVTVLLINAAYRDGSIAKPYPRPIAFALRCVVPLTVVIALTAIYALALRIERYGFTVSRVWACIVAIGAVLYSVGYAFTAREKSQWMGSISRVNVFTALYLIAALTLSLTPVLSPYRISANSQFALTLKAPEGSADESYYSSSHMEYLRFDAGNYGRARLQELSRIEDGPRAVLIGAAAKSLLDSRNRYEARQIDRSARLETMIVRPAGRSVDSQLSELLKKDFKESSRRTPNEKVVGVFIDLNNDQTEEFVLLPGGNAMLYKYDGAWKRVGTLSNNNSAQSDELQKRIASEEFHAQTPPWNDLVIGGAIFRADVQTR
jgi:Domain of unknown function (DUF4153)